MERRRSSVCSLLKLSSRRLCHVFGEVFLFSCLQECTRAKFQMLNSTHLNSTQLNSTQCPSTQSSREVVIPFHVEGTFKKAIVPSSTRENTQWVEEGTIAFLNVPST